MFQFLLVLPDGEPCEPAAFVTAVPNWPVGEVITLGADEQLLVVAAQPDIAEELIEQGFNGMLVVEPMED